MKLRSCRIENFGKLHELNVEFQDGWNVFCKENGWGKSTFAAFLCVMFYGFEGERKRVGFNERKYYAPWQKGTYGGSLVFEVEDALYEVMRVFGKKESDDTFLLRDARTQLVSDAYTSAIGQELFGIDRESFQRSVFFRQNDCRTYSTGDMNAKMGNLTENTTDLTNYEAANQRCKDLLNALTPSRKTGRIYQCKEELQSLEIQVRKEASVLETLQACQERIELGKQQIRREESELLNIRQQQKQCSKEKDEQVKQERYQAIQARCQEAREALEKLEAKFTNGVPSREWLDQLGVMCSAMEMEQAAAKEQALLESKVERVPSKKEVLWMIGSVAIVIVGLFLTRWLRVCVCLLGIAGGARIVVRWVQQKKAKEEARRLHQLHQKRYEKRKQEMVERLKAIGQQPSENLRAQWIELQEVYFRAKQCEERVKQEEDECRRFEQQYRPETWQQGAKNVAKYNLTELYELQEQHTQQLEVERQKVQEWQQQCEHLQKEWEDVQEAKKLFAGKKEELAELQLKYMRIKKAQTYLTQAKEALTARYMRPLQTRFEEYVSYLEAQEEARYQLDANATLHIMDQGMPREVASYSAGCQDRMHICLRLAFLDVMYPKEKPVLFLDDPFVNFDEESLAGALQLFQEKAKDYQILYWTCHESRVKKEG
jgi:uncharacterized protein YhaN